MSGSVKTRNTYGIINESLIGEGKFLCTDAQLEFMSNLLERHEISQDDVVLRFSRNGTRSGWQILDALATFDMQARHVENSSRLVTDGQRSYLNAFRDQAVSLGRGQIVAQIDKLRENLFASFGDYSRVLANLAANFPLMTEAQIDTNLGVTPKDEEPF